MDSLDLLTLALLPGIGPAKLRQLESRSAAGAVLAEPAAHADLLGEHGYHELTSGAARARAAAEAARAEADGVRLVGWHDADYPEWLKRVYDPPAVLWVRGRLAGPETAVGVVGSRGASPA